MKYLKIIILITSITFFVSGCGLNYNINSYEKEETQGEPSIVSLGNILSTHLHLI